MAQRRVRCDLHALSLVVSLLLCGLIQVTLIPFAIQLHPKPEEQLGVDLPASPHLRHKSTSFQRSKRPRTYSQPADRSPDGTFNGIPLYLENTGGTSWPVSHSHCVGESYRTASWKDKSCQFSNLCFDVNQKKFLVFESASEFKFSNEFLNSRPFLHTSSTLHRHGPGYPQEVSLGGINQKWGKAGIPRLKWFPEIISQADKRGHDSFSYYALPDDFIWLPYHSMNGANPGHLVWDDFLPLYTLLEMFSILPDEDEKYNKLLPMRYMLDDGERGLWASCDVREAKTIICQKMLNKFKGLFLGKDYPYNVTTTQSFDFRPNRQGRSSIVCARTGAAGLATLTDHGIFKSHGWEEEDYAFVHNHGRGGQLYAFRNFVLRNMGIRTIPAPRNSRPHRIVVSQNSSDIFNRRQDFQRQIKFLREHLSSDRVIVEPYILKDLSAEEQLKVVHDASIYITLCGGGAVTGMFLPAGASVFLYYAEDGGAKNNRMTHKPALLDWDLFNAMSHLRVHWLPRGTMKKELDDNYLLELVKHELDLIDSGALE